MQRRCSWLSCVLIALCCLPVCAQPLADMTVERLRVAFDARGYFRITYKGVPIVEQGQIYLANKGWGSVFPPRSRRIYDAKLESAEARKTARLTTRKNTINQATIACTVKPRHVTIDLHRKVLPDTDTHYDVVDVFLSKPLLTGSKFVVQAKGGEQRGTIDPATFSDPFLATRLLRLTNYLGTLEIRLSGKCIDAPDRTPEWGFRNVCDRPWGAEELRSFSLLHCRENVPKAGAEQHLRFELRFDEAPGLDARLDLRALKHGVGMLHETANARRKRAGLPPAPEPQVPEKADDVLALQDRQMREIDALPSRAPRLIVPQPQQTIRGDGEFRLTPKSRLFVGSGLGAKRAAEVIAEELATRFGQRLPAPVVAKGLPPTAVALGEAAPEGLAVDASQPAEGYVLRVAPSGVSLVGRDDRGVYYAAQSLAQLFERGEGGVPVVSAVTVRDWPALAVRGIHVWGFGSGATVDDVKRTIHRIAARFKLNTFVFGGSFTMFHWKSHPEIRKAPGGVTMEQLADIAQCARDHFMEFIPAFQSYGHLNHLFYSHPEIAECWKPGKRMGSYCPSNPKSYELIFDLYAEAIAATKPKQFHIGHDEIQGIGTCDRCKATPHHLLLANDIKKIHAWLKARGIETMLWGDMLLDAKRWGPTGIGATNSNRGHYGAVDTHLALDLLPKDIIIADWHYSGVERFRSLDHYRDHGFRTLACPWYGEENNFHFAREAARAKAYGYLLTDWGFLSVLSAAGTSVLGMEYAWTPGTPTLDALPYYPPELLANRLRPRRPSDALDARFHPVDIRPHANARTCAKDPSDTDAWFGDGRCSDLSLLRTGSRRLAGIDFQLLPATANNCVRLGGKDTAPLPTRVGPIAISRTAHSVVMLHTMATNDPTVRHKAVVKATIHYTDGTAAEALIKENRDITHWRSYERRSNPWHWREGYADLYGAKCAWRGLTRGGQHVNLQAYEWVNPEPGKPIRDITLEAQRPRESLKIAVLAITCIE